MFASSVHGTEGSAPFGWGPNSMAREPKKKKKRFLWKLWREQGVLPRPTLSSPPLALSPPSFPQCPKCSCLANSTNEVTPTLNPSAHSHFINWASLTSPSFSQLSFSCLADLLSFPHFPVCSAYSTSFSLPHLLSSLPNQICKLKPQRKSYFSCNA